MKNSNSEVAYDFIKKRILSGEYPPGAALMTNALAPEIKVSRTPIHDALRQLETDGLVIIQPRVGAHVKQMDLKEFRDMCELRLALESHAAGLAARQHSDLHLQEIKFALESMRALTEQVVAQPKEVELLQELVREDVRFHLAIMTAANNDIMKKEILRLHVVNRVVSAPVRSQDPDAAGDPREEEALRRKVLACHEEIYQAIAAGDAVAAKKAMEAHIQDIIDRNLRSMVRDRPNLVTRELSDEEAIYTP